MVKALSSVGYKTQAQTLSHFYDDYGLKADGEDGEEEEEDEEDGEDGGSEDGSDESGSDEDMED